VRAGLPIYGFDQRGMWTFQPASYRGLKITCSDRKPPSGATMRRAIGFRPPASVVPKGSAPPAQPVSGVASPRGLPENTF
jgi:hypothetical protein